MPDTNPPDAKLYRFLSFIESRPLISQIRLRTSLVNEFFDESEWDFVLTFSKSQGYWKAVGDSCLQITEAGRRWLEDHADDALMLDEEDTSSDRGPSKPYQVTKLKMEPKTLSIFQALRKIDKKEIEINPDFQRAFVWDEIRQSRLIESVLIRIPLPAFYLDATDQVKWAVVDGLQRLTTLHRFCNEKTLKLTKLQFLTELEGLGFDELPKSFQVLLEDDTSLQFYNLMPGTPVEAKFTIFSRVNTGGMQLTPQEIRHALTQGKVTRWLAGIARGDSFLRATGGAVETMRMSDRELCLRAIAFMAFGIEAYREFAEFDGFLLYAMNELNAFPDEKLATLASAFCSGLDKAHALFGRYAFRKFYEHGGRRSPLNKALFEVWVKCLADTSSEKLVKDRDIIINGFLKLMNDDYSFLQSISSSTGSFSAVQLRFQTVAKLLAGGGL